MDSALARNEVPVTVLTGFLGSGKTTLLRRALQAPAFCDTAVVLNELGAIAIDHYLVDIAEGGVVELPGGCLCCAVREDLAATLRSLLERRDAGEIRAFRRIAVETSGLADPAPILFTLGTDPMLDARLRLARVVTVIDAMTGAATLDRFAEAARQVAVADALYISKTDLAPFGSPLAARLDALNPGAERLVGAVGEPPEVLFTAGSTRAASTPTLPSPACGGGFSRVPSPAGGGGFSRVPAPAGGGGLGWGHADGRGTSEAAAAPKAAHTHGIAAYAVVLGAPVGRLDFARALGGLARERGSDLLRVKGIVAFADRPDHPAIVQAAQHAMLAPEWLDAWPDQDRRSRLVFIVHDIAPEEILDRFRFASPALIAPHR